MKYMKLNSLIALRKELGLKDISPKTEKEVICRKCGAVMRKTGDNAYVCDAVKDDKRCGYFYIKKLRG